MKHIDELQVLLENSPIDILAINESKIDDKVSDDEIHTRNTCMQQPLATN